MANREAGDRIVSIVTFSQLFLQRLFIQSLLLFPCLIFLWTLSSNIYHSECESQFYRIVGGKRILKKGSNEIVVTGDDSLLDNSVD